MEFNSPEDRVEVGVKEHYTYLTRSIIELFNEGQLPNVVGLDIDVEYGYFTRLGYDDGSYRITYGYDLGLNTGAAEDIAKDKGHTKSLLGKIGVNFPEGEEFLLPWWFEKIAPKQIERGNTDMKRTEQASAYIDTELGYPIYVKPVHGSKGSGVHKVMTTVELDEVFEEFNEERVRVAIVEEAVLMPDFRVVMLDGDLISAYERVPLEVIGDAEHSIDELISLLQQKFIVDGRDTILDVNDHRIKKELERQKLYFSSIPNVGERIPLASVSNLSVGGSSVDVTEVIHQHWIDLCKDVAHSFNLRLCGVDIACEDIENPNSDYRVLEVNSSPGLDHYAKSGEAQEQIVKNLYARVLNAYPHQ